MEKSKAQAIGVTGDRSKSIPESFSYVLFCTSTRTHAHIPDTPTGTVRNADVPGEGKKEVLQHAIASDALI